MADGGFESHLGLGFLPEYHIFKLRRFIYLTRIMQQMTIQTHFLLSILLAPPPQPPPPPPTFKQFVGNGQKLVQTRDSWKIQKKGNNVLAGKRKRVLVRKTRLLATSLSILISVVTISFLFQIHLFILWQNSRIVASTLRCSLRIHFSTQSVQNCLLFPSFCEMKALEVKEDCGSFTTETEWINMYFKRLLRSDHNYTQPWKPLSFAMGCKMCARFYEDRCAIVLMKNTSILHLYSFDR